MAQEQVLTAAEQRKAEAKAEEKLRKRSELVRASPGLLPYGTPEELAEMVGRVRFMVQGGDKLKDNEIWALAQASFALGLNPIIGECWWLPGLGFMPGIKGLRRLGRDQFTKRDAHEDLHFELITKKTDFEAYKIPLEALAFFCKGTVSDKRRAQAEDAKVWRDALGPDAPYEVILKRVGPPTETIGIGFVTAEQMEELDNPRWYHVCEADKDANTVYIYKKFQRELRGHDPCPDCSKKSYARVNAMPHTQRAQKRAEAHWWKQECDLPFNILPGGEGLADELDIDGMFSETIEGSFLPDSLKTGEEVEKYRELKKESDENNERLDDLDEDELKERAAEASEILFGGQEEEPPKKGDVERPLDPQTLRSFMAKKTKKHGKKDASTDQLGLAMGMLNVCFAGRENSEDLRRSVLAYLFEVDSGKDLTGAQTLSLLDWLKPIRDDGGAYTPDPLAVAESQRVVNAYLVEQGQEILPEFGKG